MEIKVDLQGEVLMYAKYFKRILDFILSLIAFIILLPVMIIIYML